MFGFRFSDSDYITIRCEVGIFPSNTEKVNCPLTVFFTFDDRKDDILELTSYSYVIIRNSFFFGRNCVTVVDVKEEEQKTLKLKQSLLRLKLEYMTTRTCIKWRTKVLKNHVNYPSCIFIISRFVPSTYTVTNFTHDDRISQFTGYILVYGDLFLQ